MTDKPTVMLSKEVVFQLAKKIVEKGDVDAFNSQFMLMTRQMFEQVEQSIRADERQKVLAEVLEWSKARQYSDEYGVDVAIRFSELRAKLAEMKEGNGR